MTTATVRIAAKAAETGQILQFDGLTGYVENVDPDVDGFVWITVLENDKRRLWRCGNDELLIVLSERECR